MWAGVCSALILGIIDIPTAVYCLRYHEGVLWFILFCVVMTVIFLISAAISMTVVMAQLVMFIICIVFVYGA